MMLQHLKERLEFDHVIMEYEREKVKAEYESSKDSDTTTARSTSGRTFKRRLTGESILFDADTNFGARAYPNVRTKEELNAD